MGIVESIGVFVVNLLVGGFGIYVAGRIVAGAESHEYALWTALIGALVWGVVSFFFGWIPLLGPLLALLAWVGVINHRYPGGWTDAGIIGVLAWLAVIVVLVLLQPVLGPLDAVGIPGV